MNTMIYILLHHFFLHLIMSHGRFISRTLLAVSVRMKAKLARKLWLAHALHCWMRSCLRVT